METIDLSGNVFESWQHLHQELEAHTEAGRWREAVSVLERLAELEDTPAEQALCLQSAAFISRDRLAEEAEAFRLFATALAQLGSEGEAGLRARLWDSLGRLAWERMSDGVTALAALEAAQALAATDEREEALAGIALAAGAADKAVAWHQRLAAHTPDDPRPYRALERLWADDPGPRRWASAVLAQLDQAAAESPPAIDARALPDPWERLCHPDEDRRASSAFALVAPGLLSRHSGAAEPALRWQEGGDDFTAQALARASQLLALPPPALAFGQGLAEPIALRNLGRAERAVATLVIDERWAAEAPRAELAFAISRAVALSRPEWFLRFALPAPELAAVDPTVDLPRWTAACELSAARAALLVTGDLAAAARVIGAEPPVAGILAAAERIKDLLAFAVSEDHLAFRRAVERDSHVDR